MRKKDLKKGSFFMTTVINRTLFSLLQKIFSDICRKNINMTQTTFCVIIITITVTFFFSDKTVSSKTKQERR